MMRPGLYSALYLAGVRPGDEVIVSPFDLRRDGNADRQPVCPAWCWRDVHPVTGMIDPEQISGLISARTRALMLYHWSGNVANIGRIAALTKRHGIRLIQDASEAFGAEYLGRRLGHEADFTVYSFYATKHINCGEGAAFLLRIPKFWKRPCACGDSASITLRFALPTATLISASIFLSRDSILR